MTAMVDDLDEDLGPRVEDDLDEFGFDDTEPMPDGGAEALDWADMVFRIIRKLDRHRATLQQHADREHARIDAWLEDRTAGIDQRKAYLTERLERFGRAYKQRAKKAPPKLVNGRITLTAPRLRVDVTDEEAFVKWAKENKRIDLLRIKETPAKDELQKVVKEGRVRATAQEEKRMSAVLADGEVVPGIELVRPTEDSFTATTT